MTKELYLSVLLFALCAGFAVAAQAVKSFMARSSGPPTWADSGSYFHTPLLWAAGRGLLPGGSSPGTPCTRGEVIAFLWRAAGCPEHTAGNMPFADVPKNSPYYRAVLWAWEKGIAIGTDASSFSPGATCTRGQAVTFLWRFYGSPAAVKAPFLDVKDGAYYATAAWWAFCRGITRGTGHMAFSPDAACTWCEAAVFLYRAMTGDS
ncbi:MAG: S-layer homology domain-containing protein [Oscillospiraceae bacterium]